VRIWALLHSWPGRYLVAVAVVGGATVLTALLPDEIERRNGTLFFGAVMVSAWWGGFGAGLVSTFLSAASIAYLFMPMLHTFGYAQDDQIRLSLFVTVAALISYLNGARQRAEERHAELLLREKIGRARSESLEWRYGALAEAAVVVARARDAAPAVQRLAQLAVPRFARASAVYVRGAAGVLVPLAAVRPEGETPGEHETAAAAHAAASGHADTTPRLIAVPLTSAGGVVGVMAFVAGAERSYRDEDLAFAQDLGHHAALILGRGVTVA
jgi:K+-sensing histidine kinase KdpD